jgi:hypothetical protein
MTGNHNTLIGPGAGASLTTGSHNFLCGVEAGADLTIEDGCVIIGDGIRSMDPRKCEDCLVIGGAVIGRTLFEHRLTLRDLLEVKLVDWQVPLNVEPDEATLVAHQMLCVPTDLPRHFG